MDTLIKNSIHTAEITGYTSTGAGVCRINGRAVFVERALAGEIWEVLIMKAGSTAVYGRGLRLLKPSPARRDPGCPAFGKCGGCDLLHMDYKEELRMKLDRVNDALHRIGGLDFNVDEIIPSDEDRLYRYRNKVIFNISPGENGRPRAGFYRRRSHDLVPCGDCLIQSELSVKAAGALCRFMEENNIPTYDEVTGKGAIRHLFVRTAVKTEDASAVIVSAKALGGKEEALVNALRQSCPSLTGVSLCINKAPGNTVLTGDLRPLWGRPYIIDELLGVRFRISPESFFQINPPQAEKLYSRAAQYASGSGTILDLYCGAGTIGLCLARSAEKVIGAEIVPSAIENARENARLNGIENAEFILADASEAAEKLRASGLSPDAVIVDPPRKGLTPALIGTIAGMSPEKLVYVSCDPATLARDLKLFKEKGYAPSEGAAVDMFPRTAHVETVVLMSRVEK